jgi:hypothetical protein
LVRRFAFYLDYLAIPEHLEEVQDIDYFDVIGLSCNWFQGHKNQPAVGMPLFKGP